MIVFAGVVDIIAAGVEATVQSLESYPLTSGFVIGYMSAISSLVIAGVIGVNDV